MLITDLIQFDLIYLGTPYTKYAAGRDAASVEAARIAGECLRVGLDVFAPIPYSHYVETQSGIGPNDLSIWLRLNAVMMDKSEALLIATMQGWQESIGLIEEARIFRDEDKPIFFIDPSALIVSVTP